MRSRARAAVLFEIKRRTVYSSIRIQCARSSMVRAPSLYLGGSWFKSRRAHQNPRTSLNELPHALGERFVYAVGTLLLGTKRPLHVALVKGTDDL